MNPIIIYIIFLIVGIAVSALFFSMKQKNKVNVLDEKRNTTLPNASANKPDTIEDRVSKNYDSELKEKNEILKTQLDNSKIVNELGQRVTSSLSLDDTFQHLYKTLNSLMDVAVLELGVFYWKENHWKIFSNIEIKNISDEEHYSNNMAEWSLKNNREIFLEDAENDFGRFVFKPLTLSNGKIAQSVMVFPILLKGREIGALTVISFRRNAFDNFHIEMLRSLLPYVAVALENSMVHQDLINMQNQLIQNEKMASLGQLSSGIAHEMLNPLNFVNNFSKISIDLIPEIETSDSKEEQKELTDMLVSNLEKINQHGNRAYAIVKNMMLLSRHGNGEKTDVDINNIVEEFIEISYNGFRTKVQNFECRIEKIFDHKMQNAKVITEDFGTVLRNFFSNAFYAMNEKTKKINSMKNKRTEFVFEPELIVKTTFRQPNFIISIRDNGIGIPDEIKSKIFLPFFTTKPTGEGTGLGLSLSHDIIVKGLNGEISLDTEIGKGSEFKISFPAA